MYLLIIKTKVMKSNLIVTLAVCMVLSIPTYAFHDSPNPLIEKSFKNHFPAAIEPVWEKTKENEDAFHVRFKNEGYDIDAYFSTDGTLIGYGRKVELKNLPFNIQRVFNADYGQYLVLKLWEIFRNDSTRYLFLLHNENKNVLIEIHQDGSISRHKKKLFIK
jgi:hypothetical protein